MRVDNEPRRVLFAEDRKATVREWIAGLASDGFSIDTAAAEDMVLRARTGLLVFGYRQHELHLTSSAAMAGKAAEDHRYAACFLDSVLVDGGSYGAAARLVRSPHRPAVDLRSDNVQVQAARLGDILQVDIDDLVKAGRIATADKDYISNRPILRSIFGFPLLPLPSPAPPSSSGPVR